MIDTNVNEESFILRNLDNGETKDIRSSTFSSLSQLENLSSSSDTWKQFWEELHKTHYQLCKAAQDNNVDAIKNILDGPLPVEINMKLPDSWCALQYACTECNVEAATLLLLRGGDPNLTNSQGRSSLHIGAIRGSLKICQALLEHKAQVSQKDEQDNTPLHYASYHNHFEIVQLFLQFDADLTIRNKQGYLPQQMTQDPQIQQLFQITNDGGYKRMSSSGLILHGREEHVSTLIKKSLEKPLRKTSSSTINTKTTLNLHRQKRIYIQVVNKQNSFSSSTTERSYGPSDFSILSCLGKGSFGQVYLVKLKNSSQYYAMKVLSKQRVYSSNLTNYALAEKQVLQVMESPFIVKLHFAFQTENKLYLIMDYCPGGDLEMQLFRKGVIKEQLVKQYVAEVVLALEALHSNCIIFRDLKPSNVVIDSDGHACLTDFGLSKCDIQFGQRTKSFCGSLAYLAPEMIERKGHSFSLDWYMLGLFTYELLDGYPPFYDKDKDKLIQNIKYAKLKLPSGISAECADFISQLLIRDPLKRLGAKLDATEVKQHPFFKDIDWGMVYEKRLNLPKPYNQIQEYQDDEDELKVTFSTAATTPAQPSKSHLSNWSFIRPETSSVINPSFSFRY